MAFIQYTYHHQQHTYQHRQPYRLLFTAFVWLVVSVCCVAQKNIYGINDRLYVMYTEAYTLRAKPEGLRLAQQMLHEAELMRDGKAQCLALSVVMFYHYYLLNDEAGFRQAVKDMQDRALKTGYRQYYYFGMTNTVNWLLMRKRNYEAMDYVNRFLEEARKGNDMLGMWGGLNSLAQVHIARMEYGVAAKALDEAADIGKKYLPDQDLITTYRKLTDCYSNQFEYAKMLEVATLGYRQARTKNNRERMLANMAFAALKLHKYDKVKDFCAEYIQSRGSKIVNDSVNEILEFFDYEVLIMLHMVNGEFDRAKLLIDNMSKVQGYGRRQLRIKMSYCEMTGDMKGLAELKKHFYRSWLQYKDEAQVQEMADLNAMFFNQKLEMENRQLMLDRQLAENGHRRAEIANNNLSLANTRLSLYNSDLELQRTRSAADILRLSVNNKKLETERLQGDISKAKIERQASKLRAWTMALIFAIVIVAFGLFMHVHRHVMRRLRHIHRQLEINNVELEAARNIAVNANNAKTIVLQNMTDDIKIPLSSIAGFAQILADGSDEMKPRERKECYEKIRTNTDQLLDIVTAALEKAQNRN